MLKSKTLQSVQSPVLRQQLDESIRWVKKHPQCPNPNFDSRNISVNKTTTWRKNNLVTGILSMEIKWRGERFSMEQRSTTFKLKQNFCE